MIMPYNFNEQQPIDITDTLLSLEPTTTNKIDNLQTKKQQKLNRLNPDPTVDMYNSMNITKGKYGVTQDSLNDYTPAQLQEMLGASINDRVYNDDPSIGPYQMRQDESGTWNKVPYKGDTQHLYIAPSKDGNMKLGLAGIGFKERYTPGLAAEEGLTTNNDYGWAPGKQGVDPTKEPYLDVALPYDEAARLEFLTHSNKGHIANRAGGASVSDFIRNKAEDVYGAGASEYTTQNAPMWNIDSVDTIASEDVVTPHAPKLHGSKYADGALEVDMGALNANLDKYDSDGYVGEVVDEAQGSLYNMWARATNAAEGTLRKAVEGTVVGDVLDWYDKKVEPAGVFGTYDKRKELQDLDSAMKYAGVQDSTIKEYKANMKKAEEEFKDGNYLASLGRGLRMLPEVFAQSSGEVAAMSLPGGTLALGAVRTKEYNDEYKKNNGKDMSSEKLAETFLGQVAVLNLEKFALKSGIEDVLKPTKGMVDKAVSVLKSSGEEGLQEYLEGVTEDWATQKEGDKTLGEIATSDKNKFSAFLGATMGAGAKAGGLAVAEGPLLVNKGLGAVAEAGVAARGKKKDSEEKTAGYNPETFAPLDEHLKVVGNDKVLKAMEAHRKAVNEGQTYTGEDTHPVQDEESLAYVNDHYTNAIAKTENIINGINSKMESGEFTEHDAADLEAAESLLVDLQAGKTRYFGEGQVLNNRPVAEIDKDIAEIAKNGELSSEDKYKLDVLAVERQIAEKLQTAEIIDDKPIDLADADTAKANEVLQMKIQGGISTDGKIKTGLMDYAKILLDPNISEATKQATLKSLDRFMKSQDEKADSLEKAKAEYNGVPVTTYYGKDKTKFVYHGPQSDKAVEAVVNERNVLQDVANQLRLGEVKTHEIKTQKATNGYETVADSTGAERKLNKIAMDYTGENEPTYTLAAEEGYATVTPTKKVSSDIDMTPTTVEPSRLDTVVDNLVTKGVKITNSDGVDVEWYNNAYNGSPLGVALAKRIAEDDSIPKAHVEAINKNNKIVTKQEIEDGQHNEASIDEGTKRAETTGQRGETVSAEAEQDERDTRQTDEVTPVEKAKSLATEAAGLGLQNSNKQTPRKTVSSNIGKIDASKKAVDGILKYLYDNKQYKEIAEVVNHIDELDGIEHTTTSKALKSVSALRESIYETKQEIGRLEEDINSNEAYLPMILQTSWDVLQKAIAAYKTRYEKALSKTGRAKRTIELNAKYKTDKVKKVVKLGDAVELTAEEKADVVTNRPVVKKKWKETEDKIKELKSKKEGQEGELAELEYELEKQKDAIKPKNVVGDSVIKQSGRGEEALKKAVMSLIKTKSEDDIIATTLKEITGCK